MQNTLRWRLAVSLVSIIVLSTTQMPVRADEVADADALVADAEEALKERDYLGAVVAYRKAAEQSENADVAEKATNLAFIYGFNEEAKLAGKRWVRLDKTSARARAYLGQVYFRLDDLKNARREYERLLKFDDTEKPGERILELVDYLREEKQPERAYALIASLAEPYDDSWLAQYAVAIAALQGGDSQGAMQRAARALELDPENGKPHMIHARALMYEGRDDEAVEYLAQIIGDSPSPDPDARLELALMYMLDGRDDDALSQVNQVMLENSGRVDALRLMGIINFRLGRYDAASDDFEDVLSSGHYQMDALYYLGRIADHREEYRRAARLYGQVRQGNNTVFCQRRASALLAHRLNDVDAAIRLLDDFADRSPNHAVDMVVSKAQLMVSLDRFDEGLEFYDQAVEFRPDDEETMLGRAALLLEMDRLDDAIVQYRQSLERWPNSPLTLNALGYTLADRTDQYDEAEVLIRRAYEMQPDNGAITDSLGWILYKLGRKEEGLKYLELAYDMVRDAEIAAHIVEVLVELDRRDEALQVLESAIGRDPDSEFLENVRARYFPEAGE